MKKVRMYTLSDEGSKVDQVHYVGALGGDYTLCGLGMDGGMHDSNGDLEHGESIFAPENEKVSCFSCVRVVNAVLEEMGYKKRLSTRETKVAERKTGCELREGDIVAFSLDAIGEMNRYKRLLSIQENIWRIVNVNEKKKTANLLHVSGVSLQDDVNLCFLEKPFMRPQVYDRVLVRKATAEEQKEFNSFLVDAPNEWIFSGFKEDGSVFLHQVVNGSYIQHPKAEYTELRIIQD